MHLVVINLELILNYFCNYFNLCDQQLNVILLLLRVYLVYTIKGV